MAADPVVSGLIYVADTWNSVVRLVDEAAGTVTTFAGGASATSTLRVSLEPLSVVAVAPDRSVHLWGSDRYFRVTPDGAHSVLFNAGSGTDGPGRQSMCGMAFDNAGFSYFCGRYNQHAVIMRVHPASPGSAGLVIPLNIVQDPSSSGRLFGALTGLAIDRSAQVLYTLDNWYGGRIYAFDLNNYALPPVTVASDIFTDNGAPNALALDSDGFLYIGSFTSVAKLPKSTVGAVGPSQWVTIAGPDISLPQDYTTPREFSMITALALDPSEAGTLIVMDSYNYRVKRVKQCYGAAEQAAPAPPPPRPPPPSPPPPSPPPPPMPPPPSPAGPFSPVVWTLGQGVRWGLAAFRAAQYLGVSTVTLMPAAPVSASNNARGYSLDAFLPTTATDQASLAQRYLAAVRLEDQLRDGAAAGLAGVTNILSGGSGPEIDGCTNACFSWGMQGDCSSGAGAVEKPRQAGRRHGWPAARMSTPL